MTARIAAPTSPYGRIEHGGLRCLFHGWLFDVDGKCLETPAEPEGVGALPAGAPALYPVVVKNGIVFAYLGEGEPPRLSRVRLFPPRPARTPSPSRG